MTVKETAGATARGAGGATAGGAGGGTAGASRGAAGLADAGGHRAVRVLGVRLDAVGLDEAAGLVLRWVKEARRDRAAGRAGSAGGAGQAAGGADTDAPLRLVVTPNPEIVMRARKDNALAAILDRADLAVPDGVGVVWAARRKGSNLPRVPGFDLLTEVLRRGAASGLRVYFLGATPGTAEEAATRALDAYPGLVVTGTHHGYFPPSEDRAVAGEIASAAPELLVVGMGSPRQEKFVAGQEELLGGIVAMPVGGALDVLSGKVKRMPAWMGRLGLEWLGRLASQPARWRRAPALARFVLAVLAEGRPGSSAERTPGRPGSSAERTPGRPASRPPGGSLSAADILTALYFRVLDVDPSSPHWPDRDRFVLSKGHAAPALYAVLAERGFFPVAELKNLRKFGSILQGHPDMKVTPGLEASTGSLGQGLSYSVGLALAARLDRAPWRVYVMLGDGETQEGQVWEAAMAAAHYKLDNLTGFLDYNGLQIDGPVEKVMSIAPVSEKWRAFGWHVLEIDGHDFGQILGAVDEAKKTAGRPTMIVARTTKGRGVSFMEGKYEWHGKAPSQAELETALEELEEVAGR